MIYFRIYRFLAALSFTYYRKLGILGFLPAITRIEKKCSALTVASAWAVSCLDCACLIKERTKLVLRCRIPYDGVCCFLAVSLKFPYFFLIRLEGTLTCVHLAILLQATRLRASAHSPDDEEMTFNYLIC